MRLFRRKPPEQPAPRETVDDPAALGRLTAELQATVERDAASMMAKLDYNHPSPAQNQSEARPLPVTLAPRGPSWMSADEWDARIVAYRRQGRSGAEIQRVAEHPEQRGAPRSPAERTARAKQLGVVFREEYMDAEVEVRALILGPNGLPDARLERVRNRLLVVTPFGWVNPRSRMAYKAGLYSFLVRGTAYNEAAAKAGKFTPGTAVRLVREQDNKYDRNAIAVFDESATRRAGYVPKGFAKRLAPLLDAGADLVAVSVRGEAAGSDEFTPHVLVCERRLLDHLTRQSG